MEDYAEELVAVETVPPKEKKKRPVREKYMDILKKNADPEAVLEEIMDQKVSVRLRDILVTSESLQKLLFKGVTQKDVPTARVGAIGMRRQEKTYAASTPKLHVRIGTEQSPVLAMLDSGAEVNVITRAVADELGLPIRTDLLLALKTVSGDSRRFDGACEDVEINVGGVINY